MKLTVAGVGMGTPEGMTGAVRSAIESADLLLGAKRVLAAAGPVAAEKCCVVKPAQIAAVLADTTAQNVCVLCSGDTGFYSLAASLRKALPEAEICTLPGISTVQAMAAALGRSWQNCRLVSAHGIACNVVGEVLSAKECFFLTGGAVGAAELLQTLCQAGLGEAQAAVAENLSAPAQRICQGTVAGLANRTFAPLCAVWITRTDTARPAFFTPGLPDSAFVRGPVPMTKQLVRSALHSLLALSADAVVWDVGAGTGSVSAELALASPFRRVFAVECGEAACGLIEENRRALGAYNLTCCPGKAPEILASLPAPDGVFVGGSKGALEETVRCALAKNPAVRVLVAAATVETLAAAHALAGRLEKEGLVGETSLTQLAVSRGKPLGPLTQLAPENPVTLVLMAGAGR